jgi:uncharacterized protein (TIGR00375 family)
MRFIADLHLHSKYSRATSRDMSPENIWKWAQRKGITVVGTGDFTHPEWLRELKKKLEIFDNKLFTLRKEFQTGDVPLSYRSEIFFMLTAEISCIYSKNGKVRKVHCLILAPDFSSVEKMNAVLSRIGNLSSDGRPILGLDVKILLKIILDTDPDIMLVPAHAWTPHFSVFGASSGFDSLDECFEEFTPHISAIETGLSSDPSMNWRLSALDSITLLSNSDAHSPAKLGREANIFDTVLSYKDILHSVRTKRGFLGTIEFFPEEGKYHYDGHRTCGVVLSPRETIQNSYLCPVCGKKVTVGVLHRVEKLADRETGYQPEGVPSFHSIVPLQEVLAEIGKVGVNTKRVQDAYERLLEKLGNEFTILMETPLDTLEQEGSPRLREAIHRIRSGQIYISPGFDGEYGRIKIFEEVRRQEIKGQTMLF